MFRKWHRRQQNNQFRSMLLTKPPQTLNPGDGYGFKLRTCRNGRFRLYDRIYERKQLFTMGNNTTEDRCSNNVAFVPEDAPMRQQEVTGGRAIHLQIGSHIEDILSVEEQHRSIILTHAIQEKADHTDANDHHLRPCTPTKEALQPIEPVIITGRYKEDGINTHPSGSQFLQPVDLDSRVE